MLIVILDEFLGAERVESLRRAFGDPTLADLNTTYLDGHRVTLGDLQAAADSLPFLAERRLVVVRRLLARFSSRGGQREEGQRRGNSGVEAGFAGYLAQVPPTTDLVLIEDAPPEGRHALLKVAHDAGATIIYPLDARSGELLEWVRQRASRKGCRLGPGAGERLVDAVGGNLRQLDHELEKLALYCCEAEVQEEDVARLVVASREADIFALVDALGMRNRRQAVAVLHGLLNDGEHPLRILTMVVRQWRLLLQTKEIRQMGGTPADVAARVRLSPWQTQKLLSQERSFTWDDLTGAYHRLLEVDAAIKTGQMDPELGLDLFVAEASRRGG